MTREEAIEILKMLICQDTRVAADAYEQALEMAIKALSQEPCEKPTTEDAIKTIQELMVACTPDSKYYRVGQMAISAMLENEELSKDLDEALQEIDEYERGLSQEPCDTYTEGYFKGYDDGLEQKLEEPCDDAISREMALEKMADYVASGYADSVEDFEEYSRIICQLPSVTQKSGKCKNCKYFEYDSVAKVDGIPLIVAHEICKRWGDGCKTSEDGYCYLFEPQEVR